GGRPGQTGAHQEGGDWDQDSLRSKHAPSAAHRTEAAIIQHRAVLPTQVATSNPAIARLRKTAKRSSAVRTFLNSSRPGYVATRMIGTSPPAFRVAAWAVAASASIRTTHA